MALHVSNALTQALLQFRMNNLPKEVITCLYYNVESLYLNFLFWCKLCFQLSDVLTAKGRDP